MPSNRIGRINEEIQRELASLIPTVKDPRVAGAGMVSVTAVEATPDLKYAKVGGGLSPPGAGPGPEPAQHPGAVLCPG